MEKLFFLLLTFNLVIAMDPPETEASGQSATGAKRKDETSGGRTISRMFKRDDPSQVKSMIQSNDESLFASQVLLFRLNFKRVDANKENIFHWLVRNRSRGLLEFACAWPQIECDVNQKNKKLETPLHLACMLECETKEAKIKKIRLIRILVNKGALWERKDDDDNKDNKKDNYKDNKGKKPKEYLSQDELKMLKKPKSGPKKKKRKKEKKINE